MITESEKAECEKRCWLLGLAAGVVLALLLMLFGAGFLLSLFLGILAFVAAGIFLIRTRCAVQAVAPAAKPTPAPITEAKPEPKPEPKPAPAMEQEPAKPAAQGTGWLVKPTAALPGEQELDARKGTWRYGAAAPIGGPARLDMARDGKADNLKLIKGVGPKLENLLHSMGFYHFDQIADWTADEVAWVDENLEGFKGRVTRDGWVAQAKTLAAGGETEFSKRNKT